MRKFIKEWGIVFFIAILLGAVPIVGLAADTSTPIRLSDETRAQVLAWDAMTSVTNTAGQCNPNGVTEFMMVTLVNSGPNTISMWVQDGDTTSGPWSNSIANSMDYTPADSDSFRHRGEVEAGPCFRFHTEDSDLDVTNTVTPTLKIWR